MLLNVLLAMIHYKCLKDIVSSVFHAPNQNSQDFPCFELTAKMTSLSKTLGVNSAKNSDISTSPPKCIEKLHLAYVCHWDVTGHVVIGNQKTPTRSADST